MILNLSSPSVCVIDDEEPDYRPILDALIRLGLGCVHVRGDNAAPLPPKPFKGLRLVITDLHLSAPMGKTAASHTANVFRSVVSAETAPVVVVIWSKYAGDRAGDEGLPPEDQPTEADLFKKELLEAEPAFAKRLIFVEMPKPKRPDRPEDGVWTEDLQKDIKKALENLAAFDVLWAWEALVRNAGLDVTATLTDMAGSVIESDNTSSLNEQLTVLLKLLAQQQGGPDISEGTASRHLATVLSQLGQDEIEAASSRGSLELHAKWLAGELPKEEKKKARSAKLNSLLLTAHASPSFAAFSPGTVFHVTDIPSLEKAAGFNVKRLQEDCFIGKQDNLENFCTRTKAILLEISPACDFHQGHRRSAMLLAGLACPIDLLKKANSKDACKLTPTFEDRFSTPVADWALVFCSRYRLTINHDAHPTWLEPWLRLRDILMTDIRNWHASHAARVGYLSF